MPSTAKENDARGPTFRAPPVEVPYHRRQPMLTWLRKQGRAAAASYDHDEALAGSHPTGIAFAAGALGAVLASVGYVPALASRAQLPHPWVPLIITAAAAATTYTAWRHRCRGPIGVTATLFDNALYSAALVYAAATATPQWGLGLAVTHGLMVLAFASQAYSLTLPFAIVMAMPLVVILPIHPPSLVVGLVLGSTYVLVLLLSYMTRTRHALERDRARLEEAVDATRQVADESVQMALTTTLLGLGHFLHELRNAQAAMQANLDFIDLSSDLSPEAQEALRDAIAIQHKEQVLVAETIGQLRDRSKTTNTVFLLGDVIEETLMRDAALGVDVVVEGFDQRFVLTGTPDHLRIVLTNLLRNAGQAGASRCGVRLRLEPSGRAVSLLVYDDGPGFPDASEDLFRPFVTKGKSEGTGLGLYLCRRYVELFGGTIEAEESPLGGAAFRISLPGRVLSKEPSDAPAPSTVDESTRQRLA